MTSPCWACRFDGSKHGPGCPMDPTASNEERRFRNAAFSQGWTDGRSRKGLEGTPKEHLAHPESYKLGFMMGDCAAEEAENGNNPWG